MFAKESEYRYDGDKCYGCGDWTGSKVYFCVDCGFRFCKKKCLHCKKHTDVCDTLTGFGRRVAHDLRKRVECPFLCDCRTAEEYKEREELVAPLIQRLAKNQGIELVWVDQEHIPELVDGVAGMVSYVDNLLFTFLHASAIHTKKAYVFCQPIILAPLFRHTSQGWLPVWRRQPTW